VVDETLSPGKYQYPVDGKNLNSGVYYYSIKTPDKLVTRKLIKLK